jgi:DNA-binding transcriptional ArsR family regulator
MANPTHDWPEVATALSGAMRPLRQGAPETMAAFSGLAKAALEPKALDTKTKASRLMKLLASEQRLVLLCALLEKECSVGELARGGGLSQTTASQHLAKLRAERIVETRRDAQTIYYRLDDPNAVQILQSLCEVYKPKR